ncbi:hypothetical protein Q787_02305 [Ornithobacterium rhinotracheale H06-030791]|nr:hypothetical protein Q785_02460 [Ornithobacterium rhinotracheale ORT-UMN 88]KGB67173.1 hypothetical protein Q787_02305 [Ornithobacterium rhinotracheale H06-030791]
MFNLNLEKTFINLNRKSLPSTKTKQTNSFFKKLKYTFPTED